MSGIPRGYTDHLSNREEFSKLLREFRVRAGYSQSSLAREIGCASSYLGRIEMGEREPPRYHIVAELIRVLRLTLHERNRLMVAGGFAPQSLMLLGRWDESLQAVVDVLTDSRIEDEDRERFRTVVQMLATQWRLGAHPFPWSVGREALA